MLVPLSWLKELVDITIPVEELAHRLTMAGLEVGDVKTVGGWEHCSIGYVEKVEPHPNADRLTLCTVTTGNGAHQVVCGAPNVAAGQKIAFARVGASLVDAHTGKPSVLKAAKIRGVVSEGMVCSEKELGLGDNHDGIMVLPEDAPLGMPLNDYMGDTVLDLEVTPNRSDWLSLLGVAYEVAALTGVPVHLPDSSYQEEGPSIHSQTSVNIMDGQLCPRYTASLIQGIKVGPSPAWLQDRLTKCGFRPINNVVDVTNYVMLEYGQPLHAFNFHKLLHRRVVVRRAWTGEALETLDGETRLLSSENLVISDTRDAIGIGGVIGGAESEITSETTDVLLESASFLPINNRKTAQSLRLRTEATLRFEKGLRPGLPEPALRRATQLIHQVAGGAVAKGVIDVYPGRRPDPTLRLTEARVQQVLGVEIPLPQAASVLTSLGFECQEDGAAALQVTVPYWRSDIEIEDDLVEEVARIIGYEGIPTTMLSSHLPAFEPQTLRDFRERLRDLLVRERLQEVISYSAVSLDALKRAAAQVDPATLLRVANPMSVDYEYLRPTLRASILRTLSANLSYQRGPMKLFEIGRVYLHRPNDLPDERETVAAVFHGPRADEGWLGDGGVHGFFDAKGVAESLLGQLGLDGSFQPASEEFFHPGRAAEILVGDTAVGVVGEVHPVVLEAFEAEGGATAYLELDVARLLAAVPPRRGAVRPLARYPSSIRDISILVDRSATAARVQSLIQKAPLVERAVLFDAYDGEGIPAGKSSLAYRIYFQAPDRTLSSDEVGKAMNKVVRSLEHQLNATLRGQSESPS